MRPFLGFNNEAAIINGHADFAVRRQLQRFEHGGRNRQHDGSADLFQASGIHRTPPNIIF